MQKTQLMQVQSLDQEDSLEYEMAIHSSIIAWKFYGQRNLAGYSPWDHKRSATIEQLSMQTQIHVDTNTDLDKTDVHIYIYIYIYTHIYMYISKEKEERLLTTDFSESRSRKTF